MTGLLPAWPAAPHSLDLLAGELLVLASMGNFPENIVVLPNW